MINSGDVILSKDRYIVSTIPKNIIVSKKIMDEHKHNMFENNLDIVAFARNGYGDGYFNVIVDAERKIIMQCDTSHS